MPTDHPNSETTVRAESSHEAHRLRALMERFQARLRDQELRLQSLEQSERDLARERTALTIEQQALAERARELEQMCARCQTCAGEHMPETIPLPATLREQSDNPATPQEMAKLRQENKRLRQAVTDLEQHIRATHSA